MSALAVFECGEPSLKSFYLARIGGRLALRREEADMRRLSDRVLPPSVSGHPATPPRGAVNSRRLLLPLKLRTPHPRRSSATSQLDLRPSCSALVPSSSLNSRNDHGVCSNGAWCHKHNQR
jgi:hypothetical protein